MICNNQCASSDNFIARVALIVALAFLPLVSAGCDAGNEGVSTLNAADARASEAEAVQDAQRLEEELEQARTELENSLKVNKDLNDALLSATERMTTSETMLKDMDDLSNSLYSDFMLMKNQLEDFEIKLAEMRSRLDDFRSENREPANPQEADSNGH